MTRSLTNRLFSSAAAAASIAAALTAQAQNAPRPDQPASAPSSQAEAAAPRDVKHYNLDKKSLAIQGYDPVSYFPEGGGKPLKGKADISLTHRSVTYRFASRENLERFKQRPARYEPAYGGWCATAIADGGRKIEIDPKAFKITDGRLYLFYTDIFTDARTIWNRNEPANTTSADDHWKKISGESRPATPDPAPPAVTKPG